MGSRSIPPEPGLTPDEAAAYWLVRFDAGDVSAAERAAFEEWRTSSLANARALVAAESAWGVFDLDVEDQHLIAIREAARSVQPARRWRVWKIAGGAIAASLAAGLIFIAQPGLVGGGTAPTVPGEASQSGQRSASPGVLADATRKGERRVIALPDGSKVTLNTDSAVEIAYTSALRRVLLVKGQALFEVAHDVSRRFIVTAADRQITAVGTKFEVRLDPGKMQVLLVEGKVLVDKAPQSGSSAVRPTLLKPGEELVAELGAAQHVRKTDLSEQLLWTDGYVVFDDSTLADAVSEMNRYSDQPLRIDDPALSQMRFSGVFKTGDPQRFATLVGALLPVEADRRADGSLALRHR